MVTTAIAHPQKRARQADYWRRHGRPDVAERIEVEPAQAQRCRRCGRVLSDPASLEAGVGPECATKEARR